MKKQYSIADYKIDELLEANRSEDYHWDENHVIVDGVLMTRDSVLQTIPNTRATASSIIKKDPQFDYSFMDTVYIRLDQMNIDHITYAHKSSTDNRKDKYHYQIDLYSAYPHVIEFERMPIDGTLYEEESESRLNFYLYSGEYLSNHCIITDDLKDYIEERGLGECEYLFSTDYCVGCNMGKKLMTMVYKNKKTKEEAKEIHYGYYQKRYLEYFEDEDAYAKRPQYNKELFMVAIVSQLVYIMLSIRDILGDDTGRFVIDAYHFDAEPDIDRFKAEMDKRFPKYDYRIIDATKRGKEDKHGEIMYKSYPDLPDAPRSHHKKKVEVVYPAVYQSPVY